MPAGLRYGPCGTSRPPLLSCWDGWHSEIPPFGAAVNRRGGRMACTLLPRSMPRRGRPGPGPIKAEDPAFSAEPRGPVIENWSPPDDIHFLGPTVSDELHERDSDVELLRQQGLPVLATPKDLADALGISIKHLRWLAFHNRKATRVHYVNFEVPK